MYVIVTIQVFLGGKYMLLYKTKLQFQYVLNSRGERSKQRSHCFNNRLGTADIMLLSY